MRGSRILTGAVITAAAVTLPAGSAFAEGSLDINPQRAAPGQTVTVTAMGCGGQGVGSTTASLATFPLTPIPGSRPLVVTGSFKVKDGAKPGEYTVRVSCPQLLDSGAAADPGVVQELFSQVIVGPAAPAAPAAPAPAPAQRDASGAGTGLSGGAAGRTRDGGSNDRGSSGSDSRRDEGGDGRPRHEGAGPHNKGGDGRQEGGGDDRQDDGGWSGDAGDGGGHEGSAGHEETGGHAESAGQEQERPQDGGGWQGDGGGWSNHGPHTGLGGAFGKDMTETAGGAALLAAASGGGLWMLRRRTKRGNA